MSPGAKRYLLAAVVAAVLVSFFSVQFNRYYLGIAIDIGINIILAVSLNLINGHTGQFSLGHAGFMALGAYAAWLGPAQAGDAAAWLARLAVNQPEIDRLRAAELPAEGIYHPQPASPAAPSGALPARAIDPGAVAAAMARARESGELRIFNAIAEALPTPERPDGYLAGLPMVWRVTLREWTIAIVHGAPDDPRQAVEEHTPKADIRRLIASLDGPDCIVYGHTHRPSVREVDGCLLVNPGSVGEALDGDLRPRWAWLEARRSGLRAHLEAVETPLAMVRGS